MQLKKKDYYNYDQNMWKTVLIRWVIFFFTIAYHTIVQNMYC